MRTPEATASLVLTGTPRQITIECFLVQSPEFYVTVAIVIQLLWNICHSEITVELQAFFYSNILTSSGFFCNNFELYRQSHVFTAHITSII